MLSTIVLRRLLQSLPTLVLATCVVFSLVLIIPGDPAVIIAGQGASPERIEHVRVELGLDRPVLVQYLHWLQDVIRLDLGTSARSNRPVVDILASRLAVTGQLVAAALMIAGVVGVAVGLVTSQWPDRWFGRGLQGLSMLGVAVPNFWTGMVLVWVFSLSLGLMPATGWEHVHVDPLESLRHTLLPAIALAAPGVAELARQTSTARRSYLRSDVARAHAARGAAPGALLRHSVRACGVPVLTIYSLLVARFLGATVVIETVFNIPGLGTLMVESIAWRDFPVVQGMVLMMVVLVLAINLVADVAYRYVDPRATSDRS